MNFFVLHIDPDLIIVDKPVDMIVHGSKGDPSTLVEQVKRSLEESTRTRQPFLAPSHRLDRNTCGPVIFARNRETAARLVNIFRTGRIRKNYLARLNGILDSSLFIEADVIKGTHKRSKVENLAVSKTDFPEKSVWYRERLSDSPTRSAMVIKPIRNVSVTTVVEVELWTGRHHQIRVICQAMGFPVVGDAKYNRTPGFKRQKRREWTTPALVCKKLEIEEMGISVESRFEI